MGFGAQGMGFGAQGMGFGAGPQGSNFNQASHPTTNSGDLAINEPEVPGEDPPLPPGDDINASQNGGDQEITIGNNVAPPSNNIQPLMGNTFQPWGATPSANISFGSGIVPGGNAPPGFNSMPSQVLNQGVAGLSKKAMKKKRKKEREEAQAAALHVRTYAQAAAPIPHNIPPPPPPSIPPPNHNNISAINTNIHPSNAMNVENWPDSLR
jgi:hypothetical protein